MKAVGGTQEIDGGGIDLAGLWKRLTYGTVLLLHAVSTFASFGKYVAPFEPHNLLFFAAWPMLAACIALYLLRDSDKMFSVSPRTVA